MREYKFRGKRVDNGEWVYGYLVFIDKQPVITQTYLEWMDGSELRGGDWHFVDPSTVGQYTGLKDKNGKEIYEGDIVRLWSSIGSKCDLRAEYYIPLAVEYCETWCQFIVEDKAQKEQYGIWQRFGAYEVIGNIYENPELLKEVE